MTGQKIIYTAISRNKDHLKKIVNREQDITYLAYLDDETLQQTPTDILESYDKILPLNDGEYRNNDVMRPKYHKLHPPSSDVNVLTLWVDGSISIKPDVSMSEFIHEHLIYQDMALFEHPLRKCLYLEAAECSILDKDDKSIIGEQVLGYLEEKMPRAYGLAECTIILRRTTMRTHYLNTIWWKEICNKSFRDQISLPYCLWKSNLTYTKIPGTVQDKNRHVAFKGNKWFNFIDHEIS